MKGVKLFLSFILFLVGILEGYAESIVTTPVQDGSAIADGYYAIRLNKKSSGGSDTYNYIYVNTTNRRIEWKKIATSEVDENYVWKVTSTGDGNYSLKNIVTQTYANGTGAASSSGSATISLSVDPQGFKFESLGASTDATNNGEYQYKITNSNITFHCEWAGNQSGNVVTYGGGINTASSWCFEKVSDDVGNRLENDYQQQYSIITVSMTDENGDNISEEKTLVKKGSEYSLEKKAFAGYLYHSTTLDGQPCDEMSFKVSSESHTVNYQYFKVSFVPNVINGSFPDDTHWYLMKIRGNKYVRYDQANDKLFADEKQGYGDEYWWTFSATSTNDIQVYNRSAGAEMVMTIKEGSDEITMRKGTKSWLLEPSAKIEQEIGFFLKTADKKNINDWGGYGTLKQYAGDPDAGSTFTLVSYDDVYQAFLDYIPQDIYAVGTLKKDKRDEFRKLIDGNSFEELANIQDFLNDNLIKIEPNGYYRLLCLARNGSHYMTVVGDNDDAKLYGEDLNAASASQIWKFVPDGSDGSNYKMISQGIAIKNAGVVSETEAQGYAVTQRDGYAGFYTFRPEGGKDLHLAQGLEIVEWNHGNAAGKDDASSWMIVPAEDIKVAISAAGYTTVNYPFAVELPEGKGITAYFATVIDGKPNALMLRKVYSGHIPAKTPVVLEESEVLEGEGTTPYSLNIVTEEKQTNITNNILEGTLLSKTMGADKIFVLSKPEGHDVGFYLLKDGSDADRMIPANKAYLPGENLPVNQQGVKGLTFSFEGDGDGTTGIDTETIGLPEEEFYDLQGRRVTNPTRGIYVTKSGKKILFIK